VLDNNKDTLNEKPVSDVALTRDLPVFKKQLELKKGDGKAVSGGLLYLLRDIGAAFLWLFIGEKGWKAGNYALAVGSWIISTSIGLVLYVWPASKLDPYICFLVIPGALLMVAFILHKLNESIPN
jgi:hypothetical protein